MNNKQEYNSRELKETNEAGEIAKFYGFKPTVPPVVSKHDIDLVKNFDQNSLPAEKASLFRMFFEEKSSGIPLPALLYCERPFDGSKESTQRKKPMRLESSLICLGSSRCVCECLSIQAGMSILQNIGHKDLEIKLNSIGDKESMSEFQKNLTLYIRKNINTFPADLRQAIKKDIFALLRENKEEWKNFQANCPKSIDFLSEQSRLHFKEVLEFLEVMNIPYSIDYHLMGDLDIGSETVFAIVDANSGESLASGFRFNRLAKKIGYKKELPSVMLNISAKTKKKLKNVKLKNTKPQFYLVQFGTEAKLQSFLILREFFKARVPITHSLDKDKLGGQITIAETSGASHIILIGQKEALDHAVVIRNITTRAQQIVPISDLAHKAKELILHNS
jgi:histidyl-tRNA synthetase